MEKVLEWLSNVTITLFYFVGLIYTNYNTVVFLIGTLMLIMLGAKYIYQHQKNKNAYK